MKIIKNNKCFDDGALKQIIQQLKNRILNDDVQALDDFELPEEAIYETGCLESTMSLVLYRLISLADKIPEDNPVALQKLIAVLDSLIDFGINLKTTYSEGTTPLMLAASIFTTSRLPVLCSLLRGENDIQAEDDAKKTALDYALSDFHSSFSDSEQIKLDSATLLIKHGALLEKLDSESKQQPIYDKVVANSVAQQLVKLQQEVTELRALMPMMRELKNRITILESSLTHEQELPLRRAHSAGSFF